MEYEMLETPDMPDRLQKAKRATAGSNIGVHGLMQDMHTMIVQFTCIIAAVGIISALSPWIVAVILVTSVVQFEIFDYRRLKDKAVMWDAMASAGACGRDFRAGCGDYVSTLLST